MGEMTEEQTQQFLTRLQKMGGIDAERMGGKRLKELLAMGLPVNTRNMDGELPLNVAAGYGRISAAKFLLGKGADINGMDRVGTPLDWAAGNGEIGMMRLLISRRADVRARNEFRDFPFRGWTPLFSAAAGGNVNAIKLLLENGAVVDEKTDTGITPLTVAASTAKNNDAVRMLLKAGADVNAQSDDVVLGASVFSITPLAYALVSGDLETLKILLLNGARSYMDVAKGVKVSQLATSVETRLLMRRYLLGVKGYKSKSGRVIIKPRFDEAGGFSEGRAVVALGEKEFKRYGYINKRGRFVFPPRLKKAHPFSQGLARVKTDDDKWGWIDRNGRFAIAPRFTNADDFSEGLAPVSVGGDQHKNEAIPGGTLTLGGKYGYINRSGRFVIAPRFSFARPFHGGRAAVRVDNKYGLVDRTGKFITEPAFDDIRDFSDGMAMVKKKNTSLWSITGEKIGFLDSSGKLVIEPVFDRAKDFSEGLAPVGICTAVKCTWGYVDKTGRHAIEKKFGKARGFSEGLAPVEVGSIWQERWGYIDKTGEFAIAPRFESAGDFSNGVAQVKLDGGQAHIDKKGNTVKRPPAKEKFSEGLAVTTMSGEKWLTQFDPGKLKGGSPLR